ncbi:MAG: 4a-hydroxytetrahydrobiopterin dehydratase [Anaerolineae bacterium]
MATRALSPDEIADALQTLPGWVVEGDTLVKVYQFTNYLAGVAFASAVGTIAEGHDHHPDMIINWRKVTVSFTTHDAGSKITSKDVAAAMAIEALGYPKPQ